MNFFLLRFYLGPQLKVSPKNNDAESTNITSKGLSGSKLLQSEANKSQIMKNIGLNSLNHLGHLSGKASQPGKTSSRVVSAFDLLGTQKGITGSKSTRETPIHQAVKRMPSAIKHSIDSTVKMTDNFETKAIEKELSTTKILENLSPETENSQGEYKVEFAGKTYDMASDSDLREFFLHNLKESGQKSIFRKNYDKLNKIYSVMLK